VTKRRHRASGSRTGSLLHMLAGTWRTEGQLVGAPSGSKTALAAVDRYEWVPGVDLLAHYVAGYLGRKSVASFEIWAYDRRRRTYASTSFNENGVPETFTGRLRGREWTIRGEKQRFRGTFSKDGFTLSGIWDQWSGRSWKPWLAIVLRKASA
jgi:hypothetical protein